MSDLLLALAWLGLLVGGLGAVLLLHRKGLPGNLARDLVHVGAGSWVLGWPWWRGVWVPLVIVLSAMALTFAVPWLGRVVLPLGALRRTLASGSERWEGVALYTLSVAVFTADGLLFAPVPAGAALLALALGDGLGGTVGQHWGRHPYRLPWAKPKSLEGSVAVFVFATLGVLVAGAWLHPAVSLPVALGAGLLAALAEALAPASSDNLLLPATVWAWIHLVS